MKPTHHILISLITLLLPITARAEEKATPAAAAPTAQQRAEFIEGLLKAADTKPLVFPASSLSRMEYNARLAKWAERKLLPVLNAEIAKLTLDEKQRAEIANIPLYWARSKLLSDWKPPAKILDEVLGTQSDLPVLRFFVAQAQYKAKASALGIKNLTLMLKEATPTTPPILVALAAAHLLGQKDLDLLRGREYRQRCCDALRAALQDGSFDGEDAFVIPDLFFDSRYYHIVSDHPCSVIEVLEKSTLAEWARLSLIGRCETKIGWEARGSGYADTVTPEGWEGFHKHLILASKALQRAWELNPKELWAAYYMITATKADHGDEKVSLRQWFDRVTAVVFDYMPAYEQFADALHPKWSGSNTALLAFGLACSQTHKDGTEIPSYLAEALSALSERASDWQPLYAQPVIAAELLDVYRRKMALGGEHSSFYNSDLAAYAYLAGDWAACSEAASKLLATDDTHNFLISNQQHLFLAEIGIDAQTAMLEAELRSGPFGKAFTAADDLRLAAKYDEAKVAWDELKSATKGNLSRRLDYFLSSRTTLTRFEAEYEKGKWASYPLFVDAWRNPVGRIYNDGVRPRPNIHLTANTWHQSAFLGRLGPRYEMRGKIIFKGAAPGSMIAHCGLMLGCSPFGTGKFARQWITLTMDAVDEKTANFGFQARYHKPLPIPPKQAALKAENTFLIRRDKDRVTFEFNGEKIYTAVEMPADLPSGEGATGFQFDGIPGQEIILTDMEAHLLGTDG